LKDRDKALDRQTEHIQHLESMVAERERIIEDLYQRLHELNAAREERDRQLVDRALTIAALESSIAALEREQDRLHGELRASELVVAYRQSARWWAKLPWFRVKLLLSRRR